MVNNPIIFNEANNIIKMLYGENASFRDGQYEAIEATMTKHRTLVVQRTGWGKSLVYFVCTKLMRNAGKGVTVVVSPLLVLMKNQIEAAKKLGLICDVLNSTVKDRQLDIIKSLINNELDLLLVTPETLFTKEVQDNLKNINIGLFVIDEAHCISDWGHDFRLEYGKLKNVIQQLPENIPVLATTATANNRVVADLEKQLGNDVYISRGALSRQSLSIQVLNMPSKAERYAWILANIEKIPGSGIIYCLTQRDCDYLTDFLRKNGITAESYYSRDGEGEEKNRIVEEKFMKNEIKVIVATIKLGMGYDKGDISFVIHFQMPANIVSYYQQIGRAGRNIERAYAFLMYGKEDEDILNHFIATAFPKKQDTDAIIEIIGKNDGTTQAQLEGALNIKRSSLTKALTFLIHDGFIIKEKTKYYLTVKPYIYNQSHYEAISRIRYYEMKQIKELAHTNVCYSKFIVNSLDDMTAVECGNCTNCLGHELITPSVPIEYKQKATEYINGLLIPIEPRKKWPNTSFVGKIQIEYINKPGFCLAKYGDVGYGELVKKDKYSKEKRFCDELVGKSVEVLKSFIKENGIAHICCVPSLRSNMVEEFTKRLADTLHIKFVSALEKFESKQQKEMENSAHQCANAFSSFQVAKECKLPEKILLLDDIVDSRWTMTVCGYKLMEAGCMEVYPFALADSSLREV